MTQHLRMISGEHFANNYPATHKGPSNEVIVAAIELQQGEGFEVACSGHHYFNPNGGRYACSTQNHLNRYARVHHLNWKTTHVADEKLMVFNAPDKFEMAVEVELAKQVHATNPVIEELVDKYADLLGEENVRQQIDDALNHKSADKRKDKRRYLDAWLRRQVSWAEERQEKKGTASAADLMGTKGQR